MRLKGLEPLTPGVGGLCSIHLSYKRIFVQAERLRSA